MNILIFINLIISIIKSNVIILPFKTMPSNKITHENFMSQLIDNKIYIELKIGTPSQTIPVLLKLNQIPFFITSSSYNNNTILFNPSKSSSYSQDGNKTYSSNYYDYNQAYFGEDIISIANISNKDSFLNRTHFFLATNLSDNIINEIISGEIGLNIINPIYMSFINQLKNKRMIKDYIFSLKYNTENEGEFHLGNYYHFYDDNYNESEFKIMEVGLPEKYIDNWELYFYKIILGSGNITHTNKVLLSYEFGLIYGTSYYYNLIKEIFLDSYKKNCEKKIFKKNDFYYVCDNKLNLDNFPDLIFMYFDFNFTLTKNELWRKFDGKYYFLIIFSEEERDEWVLGKIFFQKYTILFNLDAKKIGFYQNFQKKNQKDTNNHQKKFNLLVSWILVIVLSILLIVVIIYIFYYLKIKIRKKRVNELEDNYDYTAQNNNNEPISINN